MVTLSVTITVGGTILLDNLNAQGSHSKKNMVPVRPGFPTHLCQLSAED